jgi:lipopolysaccharide/colanic/teichoic acid biosynthesis glycosyltransferase
MSDLSTPPPLESDTGSARPDGAGESEVLPFGIRAYCACKRVLDIAFAAIGLLVLLAPMLMLAGIIRIVLGSPVLFTQKRPGLRGRIFTVVKFRSMTDARDSSGNLLPDAQRLPGFGRFLRSSSLDELPQLWCVLRGDMSLIGPRPLLIKYLPLYNATQRRRHLVRPGITGLAQVKGRNAISWQEKFALDVWYVDHQSPILDLHILVLTALKVVARDGVSRPGFATTTEFEGDCPGNGPRNEAQDSSRANNP